MNRAGSPPGTGMGSATDTFGFIYVSRTKGVPVLGQVLALGLLASVPALNRPLTPRVMPLLVPITLLRVLSTTMML